MKPKDKVTRAFSVFFERPDNWAVRLAEPSPGIKSTMGLSSTILDLIDYSKSDFLTLNAFNLIKKSIFTFSKLHFSISQEKQEIKEISLKIST